MTGAKRGRRSGALGVERRDADGQLGEDAVSTGDRFRTGAIWDHQHLGIGARGKDSVVGAGAFEGRDRLVVMSVACVQKRDQDAGVKYYARHSRLSFFR